MNTIFSAYCLGIGNESPDTCGHCKVTKSEKYIGCEGHCQKLFHLKSMSLKVQNKKFLLSIKRLGGSVLNLTSSFQQK